MSKETSQSSLIDLDLQDQRVTEAIAAVSGELQLTPTAARITDANSSDHKLEILTAGDLYRIRVRNGITRLFKLDIINKRMKFWLEN